ncbi:MAG TPA: alpha-glucan family phosphorylase [Gemmatimonadales bacterium]
MLHPRTNVIAYFSMEIGLEPSVPTYSGGLGVLAGDTLKAAADLGLPFVGITLAHRKGYFEQRLDDSGSQTEQPCTWEPGDRLAEAGPRVTVEVAGRLVHVRAWRYEVVGARGHVVPVYLLDADLPENAEQDRRLTDTLYGGGDEYRLSQEVVLGMGGAALLRALGHTHGVQHHVNEGHAALVALALLERRLGGRSAWELDQADCEAVRAQCVFTTHTPVPAGHDRFPRGLAEQVLGDARITLLDRAGGMSGDWLNMTDLALRFSHYVNAVARRHQEVSQEMFPDHRIQAVTNGVHAVTWTSEPFQKLFDRHLPGWREDNFYLRHAVDIPLDEVRQAHQLAKYALLDEIERSNGVKLEPNVMTIGFARRATAYKRADLILTDPERLREIVRHVGPLQIVFAGKAHPRDDVGKGLIRNIHAAAGSLREDVRVVYLQNYDMRLGGLLTSGTDLWLNNPLRPLEASGTSGMKAALNGVPSLSVLDGWWVEGCLEGTTGWSIGDDAKLPQDPARDIPEMYLKLERVILPLFYAMPYAYATVMRNAIAVNGSYFNTHRMVQQYAMNAYGAEGRVRAREEARV